jgi:hypothetical protein
LYSATGLTIKGTGYVGIGTASPAYLLHVYTKSSSSAATITTESDSTNAYNDLIAPSGYEAAVSFYTYKSGNSTLRWKMGKSNGTESGNTNPDFFINRYDTTGNIQSQPFLINHSTGYVGISNFSPQATLDVNGTTKTTNFEMTNGATSGYILESDASGNGSWVLPSTITYWTASGNTITNSNSGNVGIGQTNPGTKLYVKDSTTGSSGYVATIKNASNVTTNYDNVLNVVGCQDSYNSSFQSDFIRFGTPNSSTIGYIAENSSSSVTYSTSSDIRLKENIRESHYGLSDLMKIRVSDYTYKADHGSNPQTGYIAQQLYEVFPNAVIKGGEDAKTNPWMVDYGRITPLIVKSVQDQQAIIDAQNKKIEDLQKQIDDLKNLIKR